MAIETAKLDALQSSYKTAVEEWVAAIRREESLCSVTHSETRLDAWEQAGFAEEAAREKAKDAKAAYESGLREAIFNF